VSDRRSVPPGRLEWIAGWLVAAVAAALLVAVAVHRLLTRDGNWAAVAASQLAGAAAMGWIGSIAFRREHGPW
jgi:hypothetical protein